MFKNQIPKFSQIVEKWEEINEAYDPNWRKTDSKWDVNDPELVQEIRDILLNEILPILEDLKYTKDSYKSKVESFLEETISDLYANYKNFTEFLQRYNTSKDKFLFICLKGGNYSTDKEDDYSGYGELNSIIASWNISMRTNPSIRPEMRQVLTFPPKK